MIYNVIDDSFFSICTMECHETNSFYHPWIFWHNWVSKIQYDIFFIFESPIEPCKFVIVNFFLQNISQKFYQNSQNELNNLIL